MVILPCYAVCTTESMVLSSFYEVSRSQPGRNVRPSIAPNSQQEVALPYDIDQSSWMICPDSGLTPAPRPRGDANGVLDLVRELHEPEPDLRFDFTKTSRHCLRTILKCIGARN